MSPVQPISTALFCPERIVFQTLCDHLVLVQPPFAKSSFYLNKSFSELGCIFLYTWYAFLSKVETTPQAEIHKHMMYLHIYLYYTKLLDVLIGIIM